MHWWKTRRVIMFAAAAIAALGAAVGTATVRGASAAGSEHVSLVVRLAGPTPKQNTGGLSGTPGGVTPGGPAEPAPMRRGVFTMKGAVQDRGTAVFRMPSLGSATRQSTIQLHGKSGSLRLGLRGGGGGATTAAPSGSAHWKVISGSGSYAAASGSGSFSQTPQTIVLSGPLSVRR